MAKRGQDFTKYVSKIWSTPKNKLIFLVLVFFIIGAIVGFGVNLSKPLDNNILGNAMKIGTSAKKQQPSGVTLPQGVPSGKTLDSTKSISKPPTSLSTPSSVSKPSLPNSDPEYQCCIYASSCVSLDSHAADYQTKINGCRITAVLGAQASLDTRPCNTIMECRTPSAAPDVPDPLSEEGVCIAVRSSVDNFIDCLPYSSVVRPGYMAKSECDALLHNPCYFKDTGRLSWCYDPSYMVGGLPLLPGKSVTDADLAAVCGRKVSDFEAKPDQASNVEFCFRARSENDCRSISPDCVWDISYSNCKPTCYALGRQVGVEVKLCKTRCKGDTLSNAIEAADLNPTCAMESGFKYACALQDGCSGTGVCPGTDECPGCCITLENHPNEYAWVGEAKERYVFDDLTKELVDQCKTRLQENESYRVWVTNNSYCESEPAQMFIRDQTGTITRYTGGFTKETSTIPAYDYALKMPSICPPAPAGYRYFGYQDLQESIGDKWTSARIWGTIANEHYTPYIDKFVFYEGIHSGDKVFTADEAQFFNIDYYHDPRVYFTPSGIPNIYYKEISDNVDRNPLYIDVPRNQYNFVKLEVKKIKDICAYVHEVP